MSVLKVKDDGVWKDIPAIVGEAAGFGTVTATVDTNVGTPTVTVTSSGEDTAKNFAFAFQNLGYDDSDLQSDFADLADDFDTLQAQFDTAVAAVTTDTEVTDIRVGADGVTDTTAGASVRRQFTDLKSDLTDFIFKKVELESGTYNDYTVNKITNNARVRCKDFIPTKGIKSITMPEGYQMWITYCGKNKQYLSVVGAWKSTIDLSSLPSTVYYIIFAAKDANNPTRDLSADVATIQSAMTVVTDYDRLNSLEEVTDDIIDNMSYLDNVISSYTLVAGQAYGTVGNEIQISTNQYWRHVKIPKTDNIVSVRFLCSNNATISSYIQYVDDDDKVIALDVVLGEYTPDQPYSYDVEFPSGATYMYFSTMDTASTTNAAYKYTQVYIGEIGEDVETLKANSQSRSYNEIVRSVCRIAEGFPAPVQSIAGYKMAYDAGFRVMLCDLAFTSDDVPVCWHDEYLNQHENVVYKNGSLVPTSPPVYIAQTTYSDLLSYDFGVYRGADYENTRILTLDDMLKFCKYIGCEVYIEEKLNPTNSQFDIVFGLINQYGMADRVTWSPQTSSQLSELISYEPNVNINYHSNLLNGQAMTDTKISEIVNATNSYNKGRNTITLTLGATITSTQVKTLHDNGVGVMATTLESAEQIMSYVGQGDIYNCISEVLSSSIVAGKVLFETIN